MLFFQGAVRCAIGCWQWETGQYVQSAEKALYLSAPRGAESVEGFLLTAVRSIVKTAKVQLMFLTELFLPSCIMMHSESLCSDLKMAADRSMQTFMQRHFTEYTELRYVLLMRMRVSDHRL